MPANQHLKSIHITSPGGIDQDTISNPNHHHAPPRRPAARHQQTTFHGPNSHHSEQNDNMITKALRPAPRPKVLSNPQNEVRQPLRVHRAKHVSSPSPQLYHGMQDTVPIAYQHGSVPGRAVIRIRLARYTGKRVPLPYRRP